MLASLLRGSCALFLLSGVAAAHDAWAVANPNLQADATFSEQDLKKVIDSQADPDARYVLERSSLWLPGQTLRACFIGGTESSRAIVAAAVTAIPFAARGVNIAIRFADGAQTDCRREASGRYAEEMRFGLEEGCCSAYIGRTSLSAGVIKGPNIFVSGPPDASVVEHEVFHALGFHHEHQKPSNPCQFDYKAIATAYGWSEKMVHDNFDRLKANSNKYVWSNSFDPESLMKYFFSPEFLVDGEKSPCFAPRATKPSAEDWAGLKTAYPIQFDLAVHKQKLAKKSAVAFVGDTPEILKDLVSTLPDD